MISPGTRLRSASAPRVAIYLRVSTGRQVEHELSIPVIAHAGDGNTHPLVVVPRGEPDGVARARVAFDEIMQAAIGLDGTITGAHGVGRTKKGALPDQLGSDVMALTRRVKDALDPDGILNPGAIL